MRAFGLVPLALAGCSLFASLDGLQSSESDAAAPFDAWADRGTEDVRGGDAEGNPEGGLDGGSDGGADGSLTCPRAMVFAWGYCIDKTEVTTEQYGSFLSAVSSTARVNPSGCNFNANAGALTPGALWPPAPGEENLPVAGVDWCDAYEYCAWRGGRLCTWNEWFSACSNRNDGFHAYPHGNVYDPKACNGPAFGDGGDAGRGRVPVGSLTSCTGPLSGVSDLSGNVTEWTDDCVADGGATAPCHLGGGGYASGSLIYLRCDTWGTFQRSSTPAYAGIRCCSDSLP